MSQRKYYSTNPSRAGEQVTAKELVRELTERAVESAIMTIETNISFSGQMPAEHEELTREFAKLKCKLLKVARKAGTK